MSSSRKISHYAITIGSVACLLGAIWCPEDSFKWVGTCFYLQFVGRYFGLTFRNQKVVGAKIQRDQFELQNFLPMRKK